MMKAALLTLFASLSAEAYTKVAVIEFGKPGTVRRAQAKSAETSVEGIVSFWSALHLGSSSKVQHAGLSVVPDLFRKPDSGVVIGISGSGVDLDSLPAFSALFESNDTSVGFVEVAGARCHALMSHVPEWEEVSAAFLAKASIQHGTKKGLTGVKTIVDDESIVTIDQQISVILSDFKELAEEKGETIVVHFVVEEDESVMRRRRLSRDLAQADDNVQNDDKQAYNVYYGYGYFNSNNVWVTPFKTMFQIQYFNVVLWTSLALVLAMLYAIFLMAFMPLEPDTLLFGESAKLLGDD